MASISKEKINAAVDAVHEFYLSGASADTPAPCKRKNNQVGGGPTQCNCCQIFHDAMVDPDKADGSNEWSNTLSQHIRNFGSRLAEFLASEAANPDCQVSLTDLLRPGIRLKVLDHSTCQKYFDWSAANDAMSLCDDAAPPPLFQYGQLVEGIHHQYSNNALHRRDTMMCLATAIRVLERMLGAESRQVAAIKDKGVPAAVLTYRRIQVNELLWRLAREAEDYFFAWRTQLLFYNRCEEKKNSTWAGPAIFEAMGQQQTSNQQSNQRIIDKARKAFETSGVMKEIAVVVPQRLMDEGSKAYSLIRDTGARYPGIGCVELGPFVRAYLGAIHDAIAQHIEETDWPRGKPDTYNLDRGTEKMKSDLYSVVADDHATLRKKGISGSVRKTIQNHSEASYRNISHRDASDMFSARVGMALDEVLMGVDGHPQEKRTKDFSYSLTFVRTPQHSPEPCQASATHFGVIPLGSKGVFYSMWPTTSPASETPADIVHARPGYITLFSESYGYGGGLVADVDNTNDFHPHFFIEVFANEKVCPDVAAPAPNAASTVRCVRALALGSEEERASSLTTKQKAAASKKRRGNKTKDDAPSKKQPAKKKEETSRNLSYRFFGRKDPYPPILSANGALGKKDDGDEDNDNDDEEEESDNDHDDNDSDNDPDEESEKGGPPGGSSSKDGGSSGEGKKSTGKRKRGNDGGRSGAPNKPRRSSRNKSGSGGQGSSLLSSPSAAYLPTTIMPRNKKMSDAHVWPATGASRPRSRETKSGSGTAMTPLSPSKSINVGHA